MTRKAGIFVVSKDKNVENGATDAVEEADFETAISATGFGKFNIIYMIFAIPAGFGSQFESTTLSYVLPAAQCDLNLSLQDKGTLNAISYIGMISSAFLWGYLSDTLGRKKLLVLGYLLNGLFVLLTAFSQQLPMMLFTKFMSGFIICGPFAILTSALSEFHCAKYRTRVLMVMGAIFSFANIVIPSTAWAILPLPITEQLSEFVVLHSWNVFMIVSALPSIISGVAQMCFPESPKFLMTTGRNEEALQVFRKIYALNTGNPPETFPIKSLVDEIKKHNEQKHEHGGNVTANRTKAQALKEGFQQMRPLCFPPLLQKLVLVCMIQMGIMSGLNTLRLWLPQIFQAINDYVGQEADLCTMLADVIPAANSTSEECSVNFDNDSVYINGMIVGLSSVVAYTFIGLVINTIGKKTVLLVLGTTSGVCGLSLFFAKTSVMVLILSSVVSSLSGICANAMITVVVDLFPTTFRTMTVSFLMMMGRTGAVIGNLLFPQLLLLGCLPPFLYVGGVTLVCTLLTLALPKTDLKALE